MASDEEEEVKSSSESELDIAPREAELPVRLAICDVRRAGEAEVQVDEQSQPFRSDAQEEGGSRLDVHQAAASEHVYSFPLFSR